MHPACTEGEEWVCPLCRLNQIVASGQRLDVGMEEPVHLARKVEEAQLVARDTGRCKQVQGHLTNARLCQ